MKRLNVFFIIMAFLFSQNINALKASPSIIELRSEKDFADILKKESLILVDFFATWCPPCKKMKPIFNQFVKFSPCSIVLIDVDKYPNLAAKYQIESIPTIMIFKNGTIVYKSTGIKSIEALISLTNKYK